MLRRRLPLPEPYSLRRTCSVYRKVARDPSLTLDSDHEAWLASRTPAGPATLHVLVADRIEAQAWGPGAAWALEHLPLRLGLHDDPASFHPPPGVVARLMRRFPGMRIGRSDAVFESLLAAIIGQKVPGKSAGVSYRRLVYAWGEPAPGPRPLRLAPPPDVVAAHPYEDFHPFGIERRRADTLRRAASRARRLEEVTGMPSDQARARLEAIPGIGPWTSAEVIQVALGDADEVQVGDYHLPNMVAWNLAGEPRADDARMLELLEPYRGHRYRAVRLIKAGGAKPPRFGPRLALQPIENM